MTLEDIYFIGEIVAALAVIGSLVYVGIQLRQNTKTVQIAAGQTHVDAYADLIRQLTDNEVMMEAWVRSATDFNTLDQFEKTRMMAFIGVMFRNFEGAYVQHQERVLDDRFWSGMLRSMADQYQHTAVRSFWEARRHWYSEEFADWFDEAVVKPADLGN